MIQLTVDFPSKHNNRRVPILDLEVWIEKDEEGFSQVRWSYYEKEMKNKYVMMASSAVPWRTKRNALLQEVVRRRRNCYREMPGEEVGAIMSKFCQKLKDSGYSEKFRWEIIDAGLKVYKKQVEEDERGEKHLYRTREEEREERLKKKQEKKNNWWKKKERKEGEKGATEGRKRMKSEE